MSYIFYHPSGGRGGLRPISLHHVSNPRIARANAANHSRHPLQCEVCSAKSPAIRVRYDSGKHGRSFMDNILP